MDGGTALQSILKAELRDPFGFLAMHEAPEGLIVRTFQPDADTVRVVDKRDGRVVATLADAEGQGLFTGVVPGRERFSYRLRVTRQDGVGEIEDPYAFPPVLGELDVYLLAEGTHLEAWDKLGAHPVHCQGVAGVAFVVWAPNARAVSVVGDFNVWDGRRHPMRFRHECGVWELFVPGIGPGVRYKYEIKAADGRLLPLKADPYAFRAEKPPATGSIVEGPARHQWQDAGWIAHRGEAAGLNKPISIYEVHLGSWRRKPEEGGRYLTYAEMAHELVNDVAGMGFTHVEFLPITEYPFDGSWGYQPIGLFAPTSRFGVPDECRYLIDCFHRRGIGVLLDWVPGHFPEDPHGLALFDGTHLYEHADPRQGRHVDWGTLIYNYGRREVANFLLSSALYWLKEFHIDGLRVDAVASMLYLDYSRRPGEWIPNRFGGRENLDAVEFLRRMNDEIPRRVPGAITVAEESTAWPMVSRPTAQGGLGFTYKWNMGWMHDTLEYIQLDPIHRRFHHHQLTFGLLYAWNENFTLPISHDEVVHGKRSLLGKMPGDRRQKFANLRAYLVFMYGHPGKKLLFMGNEFGQEREWDHNKSLDWHLLGDPMHRGVQQLVRDLNRAYRDIRAFSALDHVPGGFEWIEPNDADNSVLSFIRRSDDGDFIVVVCNFTPVARQGYRIGVSQGGDYVEILNSDSGAYGGGNVGNSGRVGTEAIGAHGRPFSLSLTVPPLAGVILRPARG